MDEKIKFVWLQTSGTGLTDTDTGRSMGMTTYPPQNIRNILTDKGIIHTYVPKHFAMMKLWSDTLNAKSAERYFNKITRNNQGTVKK